MLAAARTKLGLSLVEVAEKVGAGKSSLAEWEQGKRIPAAETAVRLAHLLGLNPPSLLAAWTRAHLPPNLQEQVSNGHPLEQDPEAVYAAARVLQARLFDWHIERQVIRLTADAKGNALCAKTYTGLRPNPDGRVLESLTLRDRILSAKGKFGAGSIHVESHRPDLVYNFSAETKDGYRTHTIKFPEGWRWQLGDALDFGHNLPGLGIFELPDKDGGTPGPSCYGCHVVYHLNELEVRIEMPFAPSRWEPAVWFGTGWFGEARNIVGEPGFDAKLAHTSTTAVLRVSRPLAAYTYGIAWHPPFRLNPEKE